VKKIVLLLALVSLGSVMFFWPAQAQDREEAGVRQALEHYLKGHATGDGKHFKKAFHPEAKLFWIREASLPSEPAPSISPEQVANLPPMKRNGNAGSKALISRGTRRSPGSCLTILM
jgi:hypothetical protein